MTQKTSRLPIQVRTASLAPASIDGERRTVDVVWSTGAGVQRYDFTSDTEFVETLSMNPSHIRMDRLNAGAPVLNSHRNALEGILGRVVPGSVRVQDGRGLATLQISTASDVAPVWQRIVDGMVTAVSVGYRVHTYEVLRVPGELPEYRAVDWEPFEISFVALGADPSAGVRTEKDEQYLVTIIDATMSVATQEPAMTLRSEGDAALSFDVIASQNPADGDQTAVRSDPPGTGNQPHQAVDLV
ncbi:MAG: terminase, partial [Alphaproteobacteria bacterium]